MISYHVSSDDYTADELILLDGALQQAVREFDIRSDQERESAAAAILHSHMCGVRDQEDLVRAARNVFKAIWKWPGGARRVGRTAP